MKLDSIRWRLVFSYVLLTLLSVGLVGALTLTLLQGYIRRQTEAQLEENARVIALQAGALMQPIPRMNDLRDLVNSMSFLGRVRVRILNRQENVVLDSGLPGSETSVMWMQPDPSNQGQPAILVPLPAHQGYDLRGAPWMQGNFGKRPSYIMRIEEDPWGRRLVIEAVSSPYQTQVPDQAAQPTKTGGAPAAMATTARYPIGNPNHPLGYVLLDSAGSQGNQILGAMRQALLLAGLAAALIAVLAGLIVGRSLTAPILALESSTRRMSSGDLSARAPERGVGEIRLLARQFNHMAAGLEASFAAISAERDALRRFIADASHELRTPITALGNFIELLQGPAASDSPARMEFLAESQAQVRRMEWITANLLDLSRLDAGLVQLDRHPVSLADLLRSSADPFMQRALEKGVALEVVPPEQPAQVSCDPARMEMALGNLVENAIKFTPSGGRVKLIGSATGNAARIQVQDTGSGIAADDLPHIFERFYRGHATQEGSGLGLSIVEGIVQAHGGRVSASSQPGQGATLTIELPAA